MMGLSLRRRRATLRAMFQPVRRGLVAGLFLFLAAPRTVFAEVEYAPPGDPVNVAGPSLNGILAVILIVGISLIAIRRPNLRRWIAALLAAAAGVVVAFYVVLIDALSRIDAEGGVTPLAMVVGVTAVAVGLGIAFWILRSVRRPNPASGPHLHDAS